MGIQFFGVGFSVGSGEKLPHSTPNIFSKEILPHIENKYNVNEGFINIEVINQESPKKFGINNYDAVRVSLERAFEGQAAALWKGDKPITIGGDHSIGLANVKSGLFVAVLKDITGESPEIKLSSDIVGKLKNLANEGRFLEAGTLLDTTVASESFIKRKELLSQIQTITNNYELMMYDAHADFNVPRISTSGNSHGMWVAAACGYKVGGLEKIGAKCVKLNPKNIHIFCTRDLDKDEQDFLERKGVDFIDYSMNEPEKNKIAAEGQKKTAERRSLAEVSNEVFKRIKEKGNFVFVTCDGDHGNIEHTGTSIGLPKDHPNYRENRHGQSPKGPSAMDSYLTFEKMAQDPSVVNLELVEFAPIYRDKENGKVVVGTETIENMSKIVVSMLGGIKAINDVGESMSNTHGMRDSFVANVEESRKTADSWKGQVSY